MKSPRMHRHHIVPRHAGGGEGKTVLLTVAEHAEEHRKLWEAHGRWQDHFAWKSLAGLSKTRPYTLPAETYAKIAASNRGKKRTRKTRARMSASRRKSGHATHSGPLPRRWRKKISIGHLKFHQKHKTKRPCVECDQSFLSAHARAQFCSAKCRQRHWRRFRCRKSKSYA